MKLGFGNSIDILYLPNQKYVLTNRKTNQKYYITKKFLDLIERCNDASDMNVLSKKEQYVIHRMINEEVLQKNNSKGYLIRTVNGEEWLKNIQIEVTKRCNMRCIYCYHDDFENRSMSIELFKKIIDQATDIGTDTITITGGEPFLHPQIEEMLQYVHDKRLGLVVYTNGQCIDKNRVDFLKKINIKYIQLSLDSFDNEVNDYLRNMQGCTDKVKEVVDWLIKAKINVKISTVVSKLNVNQLKNMNDICRKKGCSFGFDFMITNDDTTKEVKKIALSPREYVKNLMELFEYKFEDSSKSQCSYCGIGKTLLYVCVDGTVKLCPSEKSICLEEKMENVSLSEIYQKILLQYSVLRCSNNECKYYKICSGGCRNRAHWLNGALDKPDPVQCIFMETYDVSNRNSYANKC